MNKKFYVTTPIYYPSGKFHIGTAYTTILADVLARYHRIQNDDVFFLTGLDEHGQKIEEYSKAKGITPQAYVDEMATDAKKLWNQLNITNDALIRTTDKKHINTVEKAYEILYKNGDIYKGEYSGKYCIPCETFYTQSQIIDNRCPECRRELKEVKEETYFFNMKKYEEKLKEFYRNNPDFLEPQSKRNEVMGSFLNSGLEDLCISRTAFNWGIKLPNDEKHILYVWLDALLNYISALGYLSDNDKLMNKYWPADIQIIGKDILRFHAIYWPIFLMALNLPIPKKIFVHDFIMMKDGKMSKSKGNVIYPNILIDNYGVDATRYTILKCLPFGQDGEFTPEFFVEKYNNDLCNDLGNLLNRTIAMINKYQNGYIELSNEINEYNNIVDCVKNEILNFKNNMDAINIQGSLTNIMNIVSTSNKYIDETSPWNLYKEKKIDELKQVMYNLYNSLRIIAILISPFMPNTSENIFEQLGIKGVQKDFLSLEERPKLIGNKVIEKGNPLFNRLDPIVELEKLKKLLKSNE